MSENGADPVEWVDDEPFPRIVSVNALRKIPLAIEQLESQGHPVIIDWTPPMDERTQGLFAALGVLVRFVPED